MHQFIVFMFTQPLTCSNNAQFIVVYTATVVTMHQFIVFMFTQPLTCSNNAPVYCVYVYTATYM